MRHEPKVMTPGPAAERDGRVYRILTCDACGCVGGESTTGYFEAATRVCCGHDDDTGRPCQPLPGAPPGADAPIVVEAKE